MSDFLPITEDATDLEGPRVEAAPRLRAPAGGATASRSCPVV